VADRRYFSGLSVLRICLISGSGTARSNPEPATTTTGASLLNMDINNANFGLFTLAATGPCACCAALLVL